MLPSCGTSTTAPSWLAWLQQQQQQQKHNQLDGGWGGGGSTSSTLHWPQQQRHWWLHHRQQLHTSAGACGVKAPPQPPLTDQQQHELQQAVLSSFRQDATAACDVLARVLSDAAKRQLLLVLEQSRERPELSRTSMVDEPSDAANSSSSTGAVPAAGGSAGDGPAAAAVAPLRAAATAAAALEPAAAAGHEAPAAVPEPSLQQLLRVGVTKGLPFVAFGFFDNVIMISAGEQIDLMFGAKLGLSSMMAAGLGNTVADVVGINISHTIERKFKRMKSMAPALTKAQLALPRTQRAKWLGCAIGMASGCLLGLTPLFFMEQHPPSSSSSGSASASEQQPAPVAAG